MNRGTEALAAGLGPQLAGEKITINGRIVTVIKQLGEGGFSFVYLVKDSSENNAAIQDGNFTTAGGSAECTGDVGDRSKGKDSCHSVLKITSIHSRQQRDIAEKEAKLLSRLSHPSIVRISDSCYRTIPSGINDSGSKLHHMKLGNIVGGVSGGLSSSVNGLGIGGTYGQRPQHLILMEYCEGGTALSVCNSLKTNNKLFDLQSLIIAFGQICNAVSYLHAQRPPIVHRDLKPVNFLVKNGAYKLCDFGSAVFGNTDLRTTRDRSEAEEIIQRTTTQMFRSPEMVDLYMSKKLTQRNFKIPEDNPYGEELVDLINRMLTVNCKQRADMTEVILCLSAIYSGRPLPPRKVITSKGGERSAGSRKRNERVGAYRTDGQGIRKSKVEEKKPAEAKKLNPNSAAARRRKAAQTSTTDTTSEITTTVANLYVDQKLKNGVFDQHFGSFQFAGQNNSSEAEKAFSGADDPFQIGEADKKNLANTNMSGAEYRSRSDESYDFCSNSSFNSFNGNRVPGMGEVPMSNDAELDFNKVGMANTSNRRSDVSDNRESKTGQIDYQFRERSHGAIRQKNNQRRRKKKGSGIASGMANIFTNTSKKSEAEI